jgi:hypothetical protein
MPAALRGDGLAPDPGRLGGGAEVLGQSPRRVDRVLKGRLALGEQAG